MNSGPASSTDLPSAVLIRVATGERITLRKDATAGRVEGSEVLLTDPATSRTHAKLTFERGALLVLDLGSSNGTFVNDVRIAAAMPLKAGDQLRFNDEVFVVHALELAQPIAVVVAPEPVVAAMVVPSTPARAQTPAPPAPARAAAPLPQTTASKRPGAWAHSLTAEHPAATGASTKFLAPAEIKQMMAIAASAKSTLDLLPQIDGPFLQVISGARAGANVPLRQEPGLTEWTIGSDPERDVVLPDAGVSAFHARIVLEGQRWKLVDQMSANGTFVHGKRSSISYISSGDRMLFGSVECILQTPDASSSNSGKPGGSGAPWRLAIVIVGVLALLAVAYWFLQK